MKYRFLILIIFLSFACNAQNSIVTDFKENHDMALSLYFYPSTLRMINMERNREYDEMIQEIKSIRFFKLDSGTVSKVDLNRFKVDLRSEGFEEVMTIKNTDIDLQVWGLEKRTPELVIVSKSENEIMLLEIIGMINITKIPKLTQTFNQKGFLDIFKLTGVKN